MTGNGRIRKIAAIQALLTSPTVVEAAQKADVSERSVRRWLKDQAFCEQLSEARRDLFQHGTQRMIGLLSKAIDVIEQSLDGTTISKGRFLAARLVIETCLAINQNDLESRVSAIEQKLRARQPSEPRAYELRNELRRKVAANEGDADEP